MTALGPECVETPSLEKFYQAMIYCRSPGLDRFQRDENDIDCRKVGQDSNGQSNKCGNHLTPTFTRFESMHAHCRLPVPSRLESSVTAATSLGVKDYDVFYFDSDLSWDAENEVINSAQRLFQDLEVNVEIKNQARVHLWYRQRFGADYPQLQSAKDGVDRYLVSGTCIGLDIETGEVYAPNGLTDTEQGFLRINPKNPKPDLFDQKAKSYQARWPWLRIVETQS